MTGKANGTSVNRTARVAESCTSVLLLVSVPIALINELNQFGALMLLSGADYLTVWQVTHVQASWTETERGKSGACTLQLILDQGADEYLLRPSAEDADVLVKLLARSKSASFDLERKVLIFANLAIG